MAALMFIGGVIIMAFGDGGAQGFGFLLILGAPIMWIFE